MGMLGKDLLDIFRPRTHVRAEFGETEYWVENDPRPILYGAVLTELLDVNAEEYKNCLSLLRETVPEDEAYKCRLADATAALAKLPFFRSFLRDGDPALDPAYLSAAEEDFDLIQSRYRWFLEQLFRDAEPEKKKGQRKHSLAERVDLGLVGPYVTGVSLGQSADADAPPVQLQYVLRGELENTQSAVLVERMYFDRLIDFVYVELMKCIQKGFIPKRCPNCARWFLQRPGATYTYCDRPLPDEPGKTCRDVGSVKSFQEKTHNNDVWRYHQRAYKKYFARVRKGNMSKAAFEQWARQAAAVRDAALEEYKRARTEEERTRIADRVKQELNGE